MKKNDNRADQGYPVGAGVVRGGVGAFMAARLAP